MKAFVTYDVIKKVITENLVVNEHHEIYPGHSALTRVSDTAKTDILNCFRNCDRVISTAGEMAAFLDEDVVAGIRDFLEDNE